MKNKEFVYRGGGKVGRRWGVMSDHTIAFRLTKEQSDAYSRLEEIYSDLKPSQIARYALHRLMESEGLI